MKVLIPKGYNRIALREDRNGKWLVEVYWSEEKNTFFISHLETEQVMGPLDKRELSDIAEVIKDVIWASGAYNLIPDK
jgi:hypothetical protein